MAKITLLKKMTDLSIMMKNRVINRAVAGSCIAVFAMAAFVAMPTEAAAQNRAFVEIEKQRNMPIRGQSQAKVRSQYGEPTSITPAVGQPPISRWNYPSFTVYFEYSHVITTVAEQDTLPVSLGDIQ